MRTIEQFVEALTHVLHLRRGGSFQEARLYIEQTIERLVGIDPDVVDARSADELIAEIRARLARHKTPQLVTDQLVVLAGLLHESAHVYDDISDSEQATRDRLKALDLYLEVLTVDDPAAIHATLGVDALLTELEIDPPPPTMLRLAIWSERSGQYASAEDWHFRLMDAVPDDAGALADAIAFFERSVTLDDTALAAGGLSAEEAVAGLAELLQRQEEYVNLQDLG